MRRHAVPWTELRTQDFDEGQILPEPILRGAIGFLIFIISADEISRRHFLSAWYLNSFELREIRSIFTRRKIWLKFPSIYDKQMMSTGVNHCDRRELFVGADWNLELLDETKHVMFIRLPPFLGYKSHHPRDVTLPLTIAYSATMAKQAGWDVSVLDIWSSTHTMQDVLEQIKKNRPSVICFEADASPFPVIRECAKRIRDFSHALLVGYGSVPTFMPQRVVGPDGPLDVAIFGESEQTIIELLTAFEEKQDLADVPGHAYWDGETLQRTELRLPLQNLDELPPIDYSLFQLDDYCKFSFPVPIHKRVRWGYILASRGCPYPCTHCSFDHRQSFGPKFRMHSPQRIVDDMQRLVKSGMTAISIEDDIFTFDRPWATAVCKEILRRGLKVKWVIQTRVDCYDRELLRLMKKAGCFGLSLGIESGNDRVLESLKKGFTRQQAIDGILLAQNEGFALRLLFMVGNPTETAEEIEDTISLATQGKAITVQVHITTPYPGTRLLDEEKDDGEFIEDFSCYNKVVHSLSAVTDEQLWNLQKKFYRKYYFSWRYFGVLFSQRLRYLSGSWRRDLPLIFRAALYLLWTSRRQTARNVDSVFDGEGESCAASSNQSNDDSLPIVIPLKTERDHYLVADAREYNQLSDAG